MKKRRGSPRDDTSFVGRTDASGASADTLAAVLEGVNQGIYLADLEGRITFVNTAGEILTGRSSAELLGKSCSEVLGCSDCNACPERSAMPGRFWAESSCRGTRADGRPLSLRLRTRYVSDSAGRPCRRIAVFWESSVQESLEKRIFAYQRLASLGEMATSLVHEVGNPVSIILGFARLLVQQQGEDPGGEIRDRIYQEANRCRRIVEQLLSYARSSSRPPQPMPVSVRQVVDETLDLLGYQLKRRGIGFEVEWASDVPMVVADPGEMKQVFLNILLNALEAMERGGKIRIEGRVSLRESTEGGESLLRPSTRVFQERWAEVRVEDEGPGLGRGDPERFFTPFFTTKEKGGGLGLSVCRRILRDRGGTVRLESREGRGARVVVELPAYDTNADR